MKNSTLESCIAIENIDRKGGEFQKNTIFNSTYDDIYSDPEVIIIKNEQGRIVFNELVKLFDYKEKGATSLDQDMTYPCYVFTCDWITAGCRFGMWRYFYDIESLSSEVNIDTLRDDFDGFRKMLIELFSSKGL